MEAPARTSLRGPLAFGTFLGAPEPEVFWADRDYVYGRHRAPHVAAFGATIDGNLVGSNFATKWGSVGFFGPITVRPDLQERGIAQALLARTMEQFDAWETRHVGLFTFPQSAKHISLYQKHGFYARFLTAIMSAPVGRRPSMPAGWSRFSNLNVAQQNENALTASPPLSRAREEPRRHRVWSGEVARRKDTFLFRLFAAGFSYGDDRDDSAIAPPRVFPTGCAHSQISVANGRRCGDGIRR